MSDLISKKELIKTIVNSPTKPIRDCYNGNFVYMDGTAARQLEILDLIENQPAIFHDGLVKHGEWISVNERLPEPFVSVLCYMPGERPCPTVHEGFINKDGIWHVNYFNREPGEVSHWIAMPEPPEGGAKRLKQERDAFLE